MGALIDDGVFWTAFITLLSGCIITIVKITYKSKCKEVECCCIKIIRDIDNEEKLDVLEMNKLRRNNTIDDIPSLSRSTNQL